MREGEVLVVNAAQQDHADWQRDQEAEPEEAIHENSRASDDAPTAERGCRCAGRRSGAHDGWTTDGATGTGRPAPRHASAASITATTWTATMNDSPGPGGAGAPQLGDGAPEGRDAVTGRARDRHRPIGMAKV